MDIAGIVAALAPDHLVHGNHATEETAGTDVQVKCSCGVRLTFLATSIAKLDPVQKAEIAFQVGTRSQTKVRDGS